MITPSFSLTATERVLPNLALDFTTASLDSRVTLTRALNTATAVNSSGNVAVVNANLPRFDYDPTTLACKGLLIEESRINSTRNNTMAGAVAGTPGTLPTYWGTYTALTGLTFSVVGTGTENGITYLDIRINGTPSAAGAYNINFDSVGGIAGLTGQTWTNTAYRRLVGGTLTGVSGIRFGLAEYTAASAFIKQTFSANYATVTTAALITQRASATITTSGGATTAWLLPFDQIILTGASVDFTLRFGLPQFEQGAFATSVIQTSSGAVTRNADVATMTGTNFSSWYNQTQGTFDVEGIIVGGAPATYPCVVAAIGANADTDSIGILWTANSSVMRSGVRVGGVGQTDFSGGPSKTAGSSFKVATAYKTDSFIASFNGSLSSQDTSGSLPTVSSLTFCGPVSYQPRGNYIISKLFYYPQRLINANVQSITY